jgi:predicted nucleic acid-binding protein
MSPIVCNASPLIVLAKADLLRLLPALFSEVLVPEAVRDEIGRGPAGDPVRRLLPGCGWLHPVVLDPHLSPLAAFQLGRGETEVIEYARLHAGSAVLLDDRAARRTAAGLGLTVHGTLSVVAMGAVQGQVESFREAVRRLRAAGLYASDSVVAAVEGRLQGGT